MPIYALRFRTFGQASCYSGPPGLKAGDQVLAATEQGQSLGRVVHRILIPPSGSESLPAILRLADPEDIARGEENSRLAGEARQFCRARIQERGLDMKLVDVEVFFDRSKLVFYFTAPSRIDFRDLVKDLVREYRSRIELRQIGVRHETQMVGALGNCGMVCCCRRHLRKFAPVTIRMAKEQNLFLNPVKISGICGRLLCCLAYEQDNYDNFYRSCPRLGKRYQTDRGPMKVLRANLFRNAVAVLAADNEELELSLEEWQALSPRRPDAPQAGQKPTPPRRAAEPEVQLVVSAEPESAVTADAPFPDPALPPAGAPAEEARNHRRRRRRPPQPAAK